MVKLTQSRYFGLGVAGGLGLCVLLVVGKVARELRAYSANSARKKAPWE
jgi:hypothetical protein